MHNQDMTITEARALELLTSRNIMFHMGSDQDQVEFLNPNLLEQYTVVEIPVIDNAQPNDCLKFGILTQFRVKQEQGVLSIEMVAQDLPETGEKVNYIIFEDHEEFVQIDSPDAAFIANNIQLPESFFLKTMKSVFAEYASYAK